MKRRVFALSVAGTVTGLAGCSTMPSDDLVSGGGSEEAGGSAGTTGGGSGSSQQNPSTEGDGGETGSEDGGSTETETETDTGASEDVELEENEPAAVVETFYEALYAADVDTANDLLHSDSPEPLYSEEAVSRFEAASHELDNVDVTEESGGSALVEFVLVLTDSEGQDQKTEMEVELRLDGEDWKIWEAR